MGYIPALVAWEVQPALQLTQLQAQGALVPPPARALPPELTGLRTTTGDWDEQSLQLKLEALVPAQSLGGLAGGPFLHSWVTPVGGLSCTVCLPGSLKGVLTAGVCQLPSGYFSLNVGQRVKAGGQRSSATTHRLRLHRLLCFWRHGAAPARQPMATHTCGHADCLSPAHLVWASGGQNARTRRHHQRMGRGWHALYTDPII